ncbi:RHS repeat-associated core domain-containing protein, partial [Moheibacter sediminis]
KIMEENHYYPFGLKHSTYADPKQKYELVDNMENTARPTYVLKTDYQYKYNGKEYQDELNLNLYDYGARNYDAALGRWNTMDKLSELYFDTSAYAYAKNTPIQAIDPDGNLVIFINGNHFGEGSKGYRRPQDSKNTIYGNPKDYNFNGTSAYWGSFDNKVQSHLNDNNAIYRDGSLGGWGGSGAKSRHDGGEKQGYLDAKQIIKNLERDKTTGEIIETIKIITHSMGGTYGKGYVKGLLKYIKEKGYEKSVRITLVADFDPFQAASSYTNAHPDIFTQQFTHIGGSFGLADQEQEGVDEYHEKKGEHSISTFFDDISKLKEGTYKWNDKTNQWDCTDCKK